MHTPYQIGSDNLTRNFTAGIDTVVNIASAWVAAHIIIVALADQPTSGSTTRLTRSKLYE